MPTYSTPGVYVTESTLVSNTQRANNSQSTAVFFGTAPRGPLVATPISSWGDYKSFYGDVDSNHDLGYSVYHYFANGGRNAYIYRVLGAGSTLSSGTVPYYPTGSGNASAALLNLTAHNKGAWGNDLSVKVTSGVVAAATGVVPTFNLVVYHNDNEVERWNEVSTNAADNRYVNTVVNTYSKYVKVTSSSASAGNSAWQFITDVVDLASGSDGSAVVDSDFTSVIGSGLETVDGVLLMNAVGRTSSTVVNSLLAKAESRGNSFVIIDPTSATDLASIGSGTVNGYTKSSYGAVYYPMLKMVDPTKTGPAAVRDTYPGGAVAGAYIRTEVARTVAKAPAGYGTEVRNALGLTGSFSSADADTLYNTWGVNLFKAVPGAGVIINGTRTLEKTSPGKYIPIRRSLNYLKQALKDATAFAVFEPNDERLWDRISMTASALLGDFWRAGGLKGANSSEAFFVVCSATNNTATTINNGEVHLEVGVALQYPAEFIVINISQWTGGSNTVSNI